jgi:hypothetical protein
VSRTTIPTGTVSAQWFSPNLTHLYHFILLTAQ